MDLLARHEKFEMEILNRLNSGRILEKMVFGGGTMLRLCHELNRYSADLDFWLTKSVDFEEYLSKICTMFEKEYEIIIPATSTKAIIDFIESDESIGHLIEKKVIKVIQVPDQMTLAQRIREGLHQAVKKNLVIFEISLLVKVFNFDSIFQIDQIIQII